MQVSTNEAIFFSWPNNRLMAKGPLLFFSQKQKPNPRKREKGLNFSRRSIDRSIVSRAQWSHKREEERPKEMERWYRNVGEIDWYHCAKRYSSTLADQNWMGSVGFDSFRLERPAAVVGFLFPGERKRLWTKKVRGRQKNCYLFNLIKA